MGSSDHNIVLETERLIIRLATVDDVDFYFELWTCPKVMKYVGFPHGLRTTPDKIRSQIQRQGVAEFGRFLVVELKATGQSIGECFMEQPDEAGIATTDIKLLPQFWGNRYGVEIKKVLLTHLFTHTECNAVEASPNVQNMASIKMQEAVGGVRIKEAVHEFPQEMQDVTCPVHHYVYRVYRKDWAV